MTEVRDDMFYVHWEGKDKANLVLFTLFTLQESLSVSLAPELCCPSVGFC